MTEHTRHAQSDHPDDTPTRTPTRHAGLQTPGSSDTATDADSTSWGGNSVADTTGTTPAGATAHDAAIDSSSAPSTTRPQWLDDACFYEVYPQSFNDSNGDGIGDIPGITAKLDYIRSLGCNALWINPCYDSPFKDAGYDVRDYTKVAPRYGTNGDLIALFRAAHERGMHVLLDLVPGHTSEEHAWFQASARPDPADRVIADRESAQSGTRDGTDESENRMAAGDDRGAGVEHVSERYIWTDSWIAGGDGLPFIGGETERDGTYILNFFKCQPALNYGFAHPKYPWQKPALGPDALATCEALLDVMRFWLSRGADGFRVDMADSLVKHDDDGKPYTIRTWRYLFSKIRAEYPQAAFVSEWGRPHESMQAGFDMDFYLDWRWNGEPNGYNMLLRNTDTPLVRERDASYFNADSGTSIAPFLAQYVPQLRDCERAGGRFDLITCNHDTPRLAQRLTMRELKLAYGMLLTMPGCPFIYYGDELGMRYRPLPTKEGGYTRTGSRTPMQWDAGEPNLGFSKADAGLLYLPVESGSPAPGATGEPQDVDGSRADGMPNADAGSWTAAETDTAPVTAVGAMADPDSLWHWIEVVLRLRHTTPALASGAGFEVLHGEGRLFAYRRTAIGASGSASSGSVAGCGCASAATCRASSDGASNGDASNDHAIGDSGEHGAADCVIVAMNPGRDTLRLPLEGADRDRTVRLSVGDPSLEANGLVLPPQSFAMLG